VESPTIQISEPPSNQGSEVDEDNGNSGISFEDGFDDYSVPENLPIELSSLRAISPSNSVDSYASMRLHQKVS